MNDIDRIFMNLEFAVKMSDLIKESDQDYMRAEDEMILHTIERKSVY